MHTSGVDVVVFGKCPFQEWRRVVQTAKCGATDDDAAESRQYVPSTGLSVCHQGMVLLRDCAQPVSFSPMSLLWFVTLQLFLIFLHNCLADVGLVGVFQLVCVVKILRLLQLTAGSCSFLCPCGFSFHAAPKAHVGTVNENQILALFQVNEVADDFISNIETMRDKKTNRIDDFKNELHKWSLECRFGRKENCTSRSQNKVLHCAIHAWDAALSTYDTSSGSKRLFCSLRNDVF